MIDIKATFEKFEDEYLEFSRVDAGPTGRPDLYAFCLLDRLMPNPGRDIVCSAEHDEIWLRADIEGLAKVATEQDVLALVRCGVRFDSDNESLCMFA